LALHQRQLQVEQPGLARTGGAKHGDRHRSAPSDTAVLVEPLELCLALEQGQLGVVEPPSRGRRLFRILGAQACTARATEALRRRHQRIAMAAVAQLGASWRGCQRQPQRFAEGGGVLMPFLRLLRERLHHRGAELRRKVALGRHFARILRPLRHVHHRRLRRVAAVERELAGEQLVEHHTAGVDVGAMVDVERLRLLRRHVLGCAAHHAWIGDALARAPAAGVEHLGQTEVDHLHEVFPGTGGFDHHVLGLQVTVHDTEVVGLAKRREHLCDDAQHARDGQRPLLVGQLRELPSAQQLHHHVEAAVGLAEVDDRHRVRVVERTGGARFVDESRLGVVVSEQVRVNGLHRHRPAQHLLLGPVDPSHAAHIEQLENDVPPGQGDADHRVVGGVVRRLGDRIPAARTEHLLRQAFARAFGATNRRHPITLPSPSDSRRRPSAPQPRLTQPTAAAYQRGRRTRPHGSAPSHGTVSTMALCPPAAPAGPPRHEKSTCP
jgi:hypothetical protein